MTKQYPKVSCVMLMYGLIEMAEEALQSFLMQDYPGEKELVIVNDHPEQTIKFKHPQVRVLNSSRRFDTVEFKHSYAIGCCTGEYITMWDSDDIRLPWSLRTQVAGLKKEIFGAGTAFIPDGDGLALCKSFFHCNMMFSKDALFRAGGYYPSKPDETYDWRIMKRMFSEVGIPRMDTPPFYIYRITEGSHHVSKTMNTIGRGERTPDVLKIIDAAVGDENGTITLNPHWTRDWTDLADIANKQKQVARDIWEIDKSIKNPYDDVKENENG